MPTWRRYLVYPSSNEVGIFDCKPDFTKSRYFEFYNALINSEKLLNTAKQYGYIVQFMPHPNIMPHIKVFHQHPEVKFLSLDWHYRDVFAQSNLVVTDYSSTVFDFAYLRKPIVYSQFDKEEFFQGEHVYTKGYFDYERDGFGEVEYTLDALVDRIIEYMQNGCQLKEKYLKRIDSFFAFHDKNNCQRVYEKIKEYSL